MKQMLDGYGVGVRAGAITPQKEDETFFRQQLAIPGISPDVDGAWQEDGGFRRPITMRLDGDIETDTNHQKAIEGAIENE